MSEWNTPIKPLAPGAMWCVWEHGGVYEWMVHPDTGRDLIASGIVIDGEQCAVTLLEEWPGIGAWQILAQKSVAKPAMPQLRRVA